MPTENSKIGQYSWKDLKSNAIYLAIAAVAYLTPMLPQLNDYMVAHGVPTWTAGLTIFLLGIISKKLLTDYSTVTPVIKSE